MRIRRSSSPGGDESGDPALGDVGAHPIGQRIPQERGDIELGLSEHRLGIDRDVGVPRSQHVVVVKVPVHERPRSDVEVGVEPPRERQQAPTRRLLRGGEPARDMIPDPAKWRVRRPPEPLCDLDGDLRRVRLGERREVVTRVCPSKQERSPRGVVPQESHGAVACP